MSPITGAEGEETDNKYVAVAALQEPRGLSVDIVIVTIFPKSPLFGVYVNENGEVLTETGLIEPVPFVFSVTFFTSPSNVLFATLIGVSPQVVPLVLLKVKVGHCPVNSIETEIKRATKRKTLVIIIRIVLPVKTIL